MRGKTPGVRHGMDSALLHSPAARLEVAAQARCRVCVHGGGWAGAHRSWVGSSLSAVFDARGGIMPELLLDAAGRRLTGNAAGIPCRPAAPQQGDPLPSRSTGHRGDRRRHSARRRRRPRPPPARPHRRAVASRPAHLRGTGTRRGRPRRAPRIAARAPRQGRPAPRSGHGRLGVGTARALAQDACPPAGRAAVLRRQRTPRADGRGRPPPPARSCGASPARPAYDDASRPTSCATLTPSRWPARACR
jgi:hypothetical protein